MTLASKLINMYESKYLGQVNKAYPVSRSMANVKHEADLDVEYNFVFDFTQFKSFPLTKAMDIDSWVDDVISNAQLEKRIDELVLRELKKYSWFTSKFDSVECEIVSFDYGGRIENLNAVAITVKLVFKAKVSVIDVQLAPALTNIMSLLNSDMAKAGQQLDAKRYEV